MRISLADGPSARFFSTAGSGGRARRVTTGSSATRPLASGRVLLLGPRRGRRPAAALADEHAAGDALAVRLELLRDVEQLRHVRHRDAVGAHQRDRDAHEREAVELVLAVAHFDVAALAVGRLVE